MAVLAESYVPGEVIYGAPYTLVPAPWEEQPWQPAAPGLVQPPTENAYALTWGAAEAAGPSTWPHGFEPIDEAPAWSGDPVDRGSQGHSHGSLVHRGRRPAAEPGGQRHRAGSRAGQRRSADEATLSDPRPSRRARIDPAPSSSREAEHGNVRDDQMAGHLAARQALGYRLQDMGLRVVENDGDQNLCVIMSLLHLAGWQEDQIRDRAGQLRGELVERQDALGQALWQGRGIYAEPEFMRPLAEHIFGAGSVPPLVMLMPGAEERAQLLDPLRQFGEAGFSAEQVPDHALLLVDWGGHVEAVDNPGLPVSMTLRQLQMTPKEADEDFIAINRSTGAGAASTKRGHAQQLTAFAAWLRDDASRPDLRGVIGEVIFSGRPARENRHVVAFIESLGGKNKGVAKGIASAVDAAAVGQRRIVNRLRNKDRDADDSAIIEERLQGYDDESGMKKDLRNILHSIGAATRRRSGERPRTLRQFLNEPGMSRTHPLALELVASLPNMSANWRTRFGIAIDVGAGIGLKRNLPYVIAPDEEALIRQRLGDKPSETSKSYATVLRSFADFLGGRFLAVVERFRSTGAQLSDDPDVMAYRAVPGQTDRHGLLITAALNWLLAVPRVGAIGPSQGSAGAST